jgi:hypothetical protein
MSPCAIMMAGAWRRAGGPQRGHGQGGHEGVSVGRRGLEYGRLPPGVPTIRQVRGHLHLCQMAGRKEFKISKLFYCVKANWCIHSNVMIMI